MQKIEQFPLRDKRKNQDILTIPKDTLLYLSVLALATGSLTLTNNQALAKAKSPQDTVKTSETASLKTQIIDLKIQTAITKARQELLTTQERTKANQDFRDNKISLATLIQNYYVTFPYERYKGWIEMATDLMPPDIKKILYSREKSNNPLRITISYYDENGKIINSFTRDFYHTDIIMAKSGEAESFKYVLHKKGMIPDYIANLKKPNMPTASTELSEKVAPKKIDTTKHTKEEINTYLYNLVSKVLLSTSNNVNPDTIAITETKGNVIFNAKFKNIETTEEDHYKNKTLTVSWTEDSMIKAEFSFDNSYDGDYQTIYNGDNIDDLKKAIEDTLNDTKSVYEENIKNYKQICATHSANIRNIFTNFKFNCHTLSGPENIYITRNTPLTMEEKINMTKDDKNFETIINYSGMDKNNLTISLILKSVDSESTQQYQISSDYYTYQYDIEVLLSEIE